MNDYRSPHWDTVARILASYFGTAYRAIDLPWTNDNAAEMGGLADAIRLAVVQTIREEMEPDGPQPEECTCLQLPASAGSGVMPHCPIHGSEAAS